MGSMSEATKVKLEQLLKMGGGYVLHFGDNSFGQFVLNTTSVDINQQKFHTHGTSKAKRLRRFWELESDIVVGKLNEELLLMLEAQNAMRPDLYPINKGLFDHCMVAAKAMQGKNTVSQEQTVEDFLKHEVDEVQISALDIDEYVKAVLEQRMAEIKKCLKAGASLSVIFLCGSVLEGVLLGVASKQPKGFNQSTNSPRDKEGKVKQFHEWTLANYIDVAHELSILGLDVKKYSHALRDFRNYIHPYQQMSSGFNPDQYTAKISWQVLKAALSDIKTKV